MSEHNFHTVLGSRRGAGRPHERERPELTTVDRMRLLIERLQDDGVYAGTGYTEYANSYRQVAGELGLELASGDWVAEDDGDHTPPGISPLIAIRRGTEVVGFVDGSGAADRLLVYDDKGRTR